MVVSGYKLRDDYVELLAGLVGGELGDRLREAAGQSGSYVALSMADCERLLAVLKNPPWSLLALREILMTQREHRRRKRVRDEKAANYRLAQGWPDKHPDAA